MDQLKWTPGLTTQKKEPYGAPCWFRGVVLLKLLLLLYDL